MVYCYWVLTGWLFNHQLLTGFLRYCLSRPFVPELRFLPRKTKVKMQVAPPDGFSVSLTKEFLSFLPTIFSSLKWKCKLHHLMDFQFSDKRIYFLPTIFFFKMKTQVALPEIFSVFPTNFSIPDFQHSLTSYGNIKQNGDLFYGIWYIMLSFPKAHIQGPALCSFINENNHQKDSLVFQQTKGHLHFCCLPDNLPWGGAILQQL